MNPLIWLSSSSSASLFLFSFTSHVLLGTVTFCQAWVAHSPPLHHTRHLPTFLFTAVRTTRPSSSPARPSPLSSPRLSTVLTAKLWERLEIEEDEEPMWYILNCVAGMELNLLRQCRQACQDFSERDVVKFVVPTVQKTRSHGAQRLVTETKVKYLGYVFGKLRLCPAVYETIQGLDLCRSWMGTVNHKGYKKLPPAPLALNEEEIEKFGLELDYEEGDQDENFQMDSSIMMSTDKGEAGEEAAGVIVDDSGDEEEEEKERKKKGALQEEMLKVYKGLKVEDMVKVTARGKFFNEDGIVRRLKEGQILVRFYTYGSMFEHWLDPTDVRKLSNIEILKGLSGPSQPITQDDLVNNNKDNSFAPRPDRYGRPSLDDNQRPSNLRRSLLSNVRGNEGPRNRRQDRVADRYGRDRDNNNNNSYDRRRDERNWNGYQDNRPRTDRPGMNDANTRGRPMGRRDTRTGGSDDWTMGDVDSQWGRDSAQQRPPRRDQGRDQNRRNAAAISGKDDWSAFVSPSSSPSSRNNNNKDMDSDDFFASLMSDLSKDLQSRPTSTPERGRREDVKGRRPQTERRNEEDDFFDSLLSDLDGEKSSNQVDGGEAKRPASRSSRPAGGRGERRNSNQETDFFANLEAELGGSFLDSGNKPNGGDDGLDDFFAKLEAELSPEVNTKPTTPRSPPRRVSTSPRQQQASNDYDDNYISDQTMTKNSAETTFDDKARQQASDNSLDGFFDNLEAELSGTRSIIPNTKPEQELSLRSEGNLPSPGRAVDDVLKMQSAEETIPSSRIPVLSADDKALIGSDDAESLPKQSASVRARKRSSSAGKGSSSSTEDLNASSASSSARGSSSTDLNTMTVPALKEMLREKGLKVTGKKSELIDRLLQESS